MLKSEYLGGLQGVYRNPSDWRRPSRVLAIANSLPIPSSFGGGGEMVDHSSSVTRHGSAWSTDAPANESRGRLQCLWIAISAT